MPRNDHFQDISVSGNISLSGTSKILPGLSDVGSFNGLRWATGFAGADAGEQIVAAINDLPTTGGTVIADFEGSQSFPDAITISKNGVTLVLGAAGFVFTAGVSITISGDDCAIIGMGDISHLDASAGTSSTTILTVTGERARLQDFKITGNRVAGGTAQTVSLGKSGATAAENYRLDGLTLVNSGGVGIGTTRATDNVWVSRCYVNTPRLSGIFLQGVDGGYVWGNFVEGYNQADTAGHAGIVLSDSSGVLATSCLLFGNHTYNGLGQGIKTAAATGNNIVFGNTIDTTLPSAGEGMGIGDNTLVLGNRIHNTDVTGLLVTGARSNILIQANTISNVSQNVSAAHAAIAIDANGGALSHVSVKDNFVFDDQGSPTTSRAVNVQDTAGGGSISSLFIDGNHQDSCVNAQPLSFGSGLASGTIVGVNIGNSGIAYPHQPVFTFTDQDTTPSVARGNVFKAANTMATTITTFNDGTDGKRITVIFSDALTTIQDGANLNLSGGSDFTSTADDVMELVYDGTSWYEISRSVN